MEPTMLADEPIQPVLAPSMSDTCAACAAPLAADQRYCVECGERRGGPRLPFMDGRPALDTAPPPPARRGRISANSTLIAGIGTLLLAMGVGVLIGHAGKEKVAKSPPVQIVRVAGGSGTAAADTTAAVPATTQTGSSKASGGGAAKGAKSSGASATGSKSSGSTSTAKAPPKKTAKAVTVGSPGHGPGYQNGKFTGNFFGG